MRNQTSFRLVTTVLPTDKGADHKAKVTQVINKVDENGNRYYPTFTEETVVITNDDRTVMETTRATCSNGVLEFKKRGLNDTVDGTEWANRALTWNPGSLCFITVGAVDRIDKDDDVTWTGDQTYTGNSTYDGLLISHKGVKYPSFENLTALEAYDAPFPGMFAVLESDGELYRYNAVTEQWDVVTTSTPVQPEKASTTTIGTVRGATDAEFTAGTGTGSSGELLIATPAQIKSTMFGLKITEVNLSTDDVKTGGQSKTADYTVTKPGIICVSWNEHYTTTSIAQSSACNTVSMSGTSNPVRIGGDREGSPDHGPVNGEIIRHKDLWYVGVGTATIIASCDYTYTSTWTGAGTIESFIYVG